MNASSAKPIRLLVVDDQPAVRRGLKMRFALEPDLEVVGEAGDATAAISLARALRPAVVLMDVEMPGVSGIAAIETLRTVTPRSAVVIFTLYDDAAMRARAREAGAAAFVVKHQTEETLLAAIRRAAVEHKKEEHGMRVAVVGGTGLVGQYTVEALGQAGHDAVVVARSRGVDVTTGAGLDGALAGVEAVVDVTNTAETDPAAAQEFFGTTTEQLLLAEQRAGVGHHVVLSIVGVDLVEGNAHYAGKRRQEELVEVGSIPFTILRATQFHEFAEMVVGWTRQEGDVATVPPLLMQPVAASDAGRVLAEIATGPPQGRAPDLAGPETQDLVDMARRALAARGESVRLVPSWRDGPFGVEMAGEVLLPAPGARIAPTTFDAWLANR